MEEGLALVGDNPLLLATKGYGHVLRLKQRFAPDPAAEEAEAESALARILQSAPDSEQVPFLSAMLAFEQGRMREAIIGYRRAVEASPSHAEALLWLSICYIYVGNSSAAKKTTARLVSVDPLTVLNRCLDWVIEAFDGRPQAAVGPFRDIVAGDRENPDLLWTFGLVLALAGKDEELQEVARELATLAGDWVYTHQIQVLAAGLRGDVEAARHHLSDELIAAAQRDQHLSAHLAEAYSVMGLHDEALVALRNATRRGFFHFPYLSTHDRLLEKLRADPRFGELMTEVESEWRSLLD